MKLTHLSMNWWQQATLGSFIFLFGIISFNAGSNLTISLTGDGAIVSKVVINTMICVAAATVTALIYQRFFTASGRLRKNWSFMNAMNGSFVGMVCPTTIILNKSVGLMLLPYKIKVVSCGGCNQYPPWGALVVGILSYFVYLLVYKISNHFRSTSFSFFYAWQFSKCNTRIGDLVDDVANAVPVHLGAGYFGAVGTAIFGEKGVILSPSTTSATVTINCFLLHAIVKRLICFPNTRCSWWMLWVDWSFALG